MKILCPHCKSVLKCIETHSVTGERHALRMPGFQSTYRCLACGHETKMFTSQTAIIEQKINGYKALWREEQADNLSLKSRLNALQMSLSSGKLKRDIEQTEKTLSRLKKILP